MVRFKWQSFLLSAESGQSFSILSFKSGVRVLLSVADFRFPLNFWIWELAAAAAAIALSEAAIDTDFNCCEKLDEWWKDTDAGRFLTIVDVSSFDEFSPGDNKRIFSKLFSLLSTNGNVQTYFKLYDSWEYREKMYNSIKFSSFSNICTKFLLKPCSVFALRRSN